MKRVISSGKESIYAFYARSPFSLYIPLLMASVTPTDTPRGNSPFGKAMRPEGSDLGCIIEKELGKMARTCGAAHLK